MATAEFNRDTADALANVPLVDSAPITGASDITKIPGLRDLWNVTMGDPSICVAILDGAVDLSHRSLAKAELTQLDFANNVLHSSASLADHGTHVASIIFGQHDSPVKGIAPGCRGLVIPIFRYAADGSLLPCDQKDLARAIELAVEHGADVINISGGEFSPDGQAVEALARVVESVADRTLIVAAAGNDGCECLHVPGALPSVLAVGAMNKIGEPLSFSNWGEAYREAGVLALGDGILGASTGGGFSVYSGTSFATPIVSGVAALLLSAAKQCGQSLTPTSLRECIVQSAIGCDVQPTEDCNRLLGGRISIQRTFDLLRQQGESNVTFDDNTATDNTNDRSSSQHTSFAPPVAPAEPAAPNSNANPAVSQSACDCDSPTNQQLAYAIGELSYDFQSEPRRDSIQHNMDTIQATGQQLALTDHVDFARHLWGFKEIEVKVVHGRIENVSGNFAQPITFTAKGLEDLVDEDEERLITISGLLYQPPNTSKRMNWPLNNEPLLIDDLDPHKQTFTVKYRGEPVLMHLGTHFFWDASVWTLPRTCKTVRTHEANAHDASAVIWTLNRGDTVLHAIRPASGFSHHAFDELVETLLLQMGMVRRSLDFFYYRQGDEVIPWTSSWDPCENDKPIGHTAAVKLLKNSDIQIERISVPGAIAGQVRLLNGEIKEQINPDLRGMSGWSRERLIDLIVAAIDTVHQPSEHSEEMRALRRKLGDVIDRFDEEVRNPGRSPQERALNFGLTQLQNFLADTIAIDLVVDPKTGDLSPYELENVPPPTKNPNCRAVSDCWDVAVAFFDPADVNSARIVVRQAVDVSDVVPLSVERPRRYRQR